MSGINKSESIANLAAALQKAQTEMPKAKKSEANPFFKSKYAPLHEVMPLAIETLGKNGIAVMQLPSHIDGQSALTTILIHGPTGEYIASDQPLVLDKENPQGQGSAITYARRYSLMSAIGMVADEDDDGNAASPKKTEAPKPRRASTPQIQMLAQKVQQGLKMYDRDEVISFLDAALGKSVTELMSNEVDEALKKVDQAIRHDKIMATMEPEKKPSLVDEAEAGTLQLDKDADIKLEDIPF